MRIFNRRRRRKKKSEKNRHCLAHDICLLPSRSAFSHGIVCLADMRQGHFEKRVRLHTMNERVRQSRSRAFAGLFTSRPSTSCRLLSPSDSPGKQPHEGYARSLALDSLFTHTPAEKNFSCARFARE